MKIIPFLTLYLAMIIASVNSYGQETNFSNKELGITLGYNYGYFKDLNYSPLNYQQKGLSFAFDYTFPNRRNGDLMNVHLGFTPNTIESPAAEHFIADYLIGDIRFDYLKKMKSAKPRLTAYLGGQFNSHHNFVNWDGLDAFTYLFGHQLAAKGMVKWQLNSKRSIQSSLAIPVVGWTVRPPYNGFNKTTEANEASPLKLITAEGQLTTVNKYFLVDWDIQYRIETKSKWDIALKYSLQYEHFKDEHSLKRLHNQFAVTGILKF